MQRRFYISLSLFCALFTCGVQLSTTKTNTDNMVKMLYFPSAQSDASTSATFSSLVEDETFESFTLCLSFMVSTLVNVQDYVRVMKMMNDAGGTLALLNLYTWYGDGLVLEIEQGQLMFLNEAFKLATWFRTCYSVDTNNNTLVINGMEVFNEKNEEKFIEQERSFNITLGESFSGQISFVNMFSPALSKEQMAKLTDVNEEECGAELSGNILSWEETKWTLHGEAKARKIDASQGPCAKKSKVNIFTKTEGWKGFECMEHCRKVGSRSPSVRTLEGWQNITRELASPSSQLEKFPAGVFDQVHLGSPHTCFRQVCRVPLEPSASARRARIRLS